MTVSPFAYANLFGVKITNNTGSDATITGFDTNIRGIHDNPGYLFLVRQTSATPPTINADTAFSHTFGVNEEFEVDNINFDLDLELDPIIVPTGVYYIFGIFRARSGTPGGDVIMGDVVRLTFAGSPEVDDLQTITNTTLTV